VNDIARSDIQGKGRDDELGMCIVSARSDGKVRTVE